MSLIANYGNAVQGPPEFNGQMMLLNGNLVSMKDSGETYIKKGYDINDIVYSIVNLIVEKVRVAPWALYTVVDDSSLKSYKSLQSKKDLTPADFKRSLDFRTKALKPVKDGGKWAELLQYPNPEDTWQDLIANSCGYKLLTGNKYLHGDLIPGGANKGIPNTICLLPSQFMNIVVDKLYAYKYPIDILGYRITLFPLKTFPKEEVMHEKYMNYDWGVAGEQLYGMAPLRAALKLINLTNSTVDTNTAKIQNGGLESIVFVDDPRLTPTAAQNQANTTKNYLINEGTGPVNWGKIATSGYKMGAVNLGLTPVELDIYKSQLANLRFLCNIFGVPSQLMNDPENKQYNNSKEGEKALTSRCALPLLTSARDNLNRKGSDNWGLKYYMDFDMSIFTELTETVGETMRYLDPLLAHGLPLNIALSLLGMDPLPDPEANEMWINPSMGQPISEYRSTVDKVNNDLNA